ncbi:MAG: hypothetical protein EXR09_05170 [Acetobacteraceae bacterium]|nr:hypothetical protein [Acetobacteraceae bacterium]
MPDHVWISAVCDPQERVWAKGAGRLGADDLQRPVLERLGEVVAAIPAHIAVDARTTRLTYCQL